MNNLLIIARFELLRLFLTRRGCLSLLVFALIWGMLLRYVIYNAPDYLLGYLLLMGELAGIQGLQNLLVWPVPEITVFWGIALYLFPWFCIVLTADQTASDRSRGTLRFISLHASRDTIFFGRFLGNMAIQACLIVVAVTTVLALALIRDATLLAPGVSLAVLVSVNLLLVLLPYTALMALVSVIAKSARQAISLAILLLIFFFLCLGLVIPKFPQLAFLELALPGAQISDLLKLQGWDTLSLAHIPILQSLLLLLLGRWFMQRVDL